MAKRECLLPYIFMLIILIFLLYDIYTILKREPFKVFWIEKAAVCSIFSPENESNSGITFINSKYKNMHFISNPGLFPHYENIISGNGTPLNGGIPQQGNLSLHLDAFRKNVKQNTSEDYTGYININMSYWHHEWNSNKGVSEIYQEKSRELSAKINEHWNSLKMTEQINQMARDMFEKSAKNFLLETIKQGKAIRPEAKWGLLGSSVCSNCAMNNKAGFDWLFPTSDVAIPELEFHQNNPIDKISKCIEENSKIKSQYKIKVYLYTTLNYYGSDTLIEKKHLSEIFAQTKNSGLDGIIISINHGENTKFCKDLASLYGTLLEIIRELTNDWFL